MAICAVKSGGLYNPEQSISTPNRLFRTIAVSGSLRLWLPAAPLGRRLEGTEWRVTLPIRTKKLKQRGLSSASRGQRSPCQLKRSRFRGERNSLLAQLMQSINTASARINPPRASISWITGARDWRFGNPVSSISPLRGKRSSAAIRFGAGISYYRWAAYSNCEVTRTTLCASGLNNPSWAQHARSYWPTKTLGMR